MEEAPDALFTLEFKRLSLFRTEVRFSWLEAGVAHVLAAGMYARCFYELENKKAVAIVVSFAPAECKDLTSIRRKAISC